MFIEEPLLAFGEGKKYIDPKMGLLAYGPCLYKNRRAISSSIRLGIIGSKKTIALAKQWIGRCQNKIPSKVEDSRLFQSFPGFTRIFGCELQVLSECTEVLTRAEIEQVVEIRNFIQRVKNAAKLFIEKLSNLRMREPRPHVVICAIPQEIIDSCGTERRGYLEGPARLTKPEREILEMLEEHRRVGQTTLFPFPEDEILDVIPEASDLRRIIKAEAMSLGIPTQLAKPRTFKTAPRGPSLQDDATRAWNFCVALYYKAEGYPWKLVDMKQGACYVGVSFYRDPHTRRNIKASVAQVFTHTGEGLVLKGGRALYHKPSRSPYLSEEVAYRLMTDVLEVYKKQMHQLPTRLIVHKSSRFRPEEISGFKEAAKDIELMDLVTILTRGIKFMRKAGIYPPVRGTVVKIGEGDYILHTKGWIPYFKTYPGPRVPTPLEIVEHHGDTPLSVLFEEVFALTKMNWNSAGFCIREPITLAYSREVGKILAYVPEEIIPRPEYLYYM